MQPALEEYGKRALLETGEKKYICHMVMPYIGQLKKAAALVERYRKFVVPYTCGITFATGAENILFDPEQVIPLLLEAFGLNGLDPEAPA
jgi:hypothetical protein